jgi:hypothetical protein
MFETEEERARRVAEKRGAARLYPGVNYDARIDRYTAEIYVDGVRNWLGSYNELEDAIAAYDAAKQERPPRAGSFNAIYRAFRQEHGGVEGTPPTGAVLEYDEQQYLFRGLTFRKSKGGASYSYYEWESACKTCGAFFLTQTAAPVSVCKGITRNCPEHRRGAKRIKATSSEGGVTPEVKLTGLKAAVAGEVENLALLYEYLEIPAFVARLLPAMGRFRLQADGFEKFLLKWADEGDCPYIRTDDRVCFL